ncbi:cytochrome P450 [Lineolata rhizophorae]|uniref:Cytochrome P450 n=1 Tax=Lineolata rhizophorae TaxID=578093 RepID=A0A6A6NTM8_9PEZI|nr:cytochrome P450 [Lineolata rhizophorae]
MLHVDQFVTSVVDETVGILAKADEGGGGSDDGSVDTKEVERAADTYQGRLLKVGISKEEAVAQCKDLVFAGTDSTGMNLASCCWFLAGYPEKYSRLRAEVISAPPTTDPQTLPYLSAVIKETLRLGMANPTLLPRVVPPGPGFLVPGTSTLLPPGTTVGLCTYTLHHNPTVFKDPFRFAPERWIAGEGVDGEEGDMETMLRDYFPFGLGARMCIARNLAMQELFLAVRALVSEDVLKAARRVGGRKGSEGEVVDEVEIMEWFNSKVKGERIEICWDA